MLVDLGIAIPRSRRESRDNQKSRRGSRCDLEDPVASSSRRPSCCELAPPVFPSSRRASSAAGAGGGGFVVPPDNCDLQVPCPPSYKESQQ